MTLHYTTYITFITYITHIAYITYIKCITLHYITLCYITLRCATLRYITLRYPTLRCVTLGYVILCYVTSHYITLHCITLRTYIHHTKHIKPKSGNIGGGMLVKLKGWQNIGQADGSAECFSSCRVGGICVKRGRRNMASFTMEVPGPPAKKNISQTY